MELLFEDPVDDDEEGVADPRGEGVDEMVVVVVVEEDKETKDEDADDIFWFFDASQ